MENISGSACQNWRRAYWCKVIRKQLISSSRGQHAFDLRGTGFKRQLRSGFEFGWLLGVISVPNGSRCWCRCLDRLRGEHGRLLNRPFIAAFLTLVGVFFQNGDTASLRDSGRAAFVPRHTNRWNANQFLLGFVTSLFDFAKVQFQPARVTGALRTFSGLSSLPKFSGTATSFTAACLAWLTFASSCTITVLWDGCI